MELLRPPPLTTRTVKSIHGIEKIIEELHKQNPGSPVYVFLDFDDVLSAQVENYRVRGKAVYF